MMMTRGSKTQRKSHAASSATARRAGRGHGIERASLVYRSAGISGLALGLACFFAMSAQVCAQTMSGSTMTVPGTAYPPSAGSPAASMGAPPAVPVEVGPHISYTSNPLAASPTTPSVKLKASPIGKQQSPDVVVTPGETRKLEHTPQIPDIVAHQWSFTSEVPGENIFSDEYMRTRDANTRSISLKETLYLALKNNPAVAAASLDPVISLQGVRGSWAVFDPDLTGQTGVQKIVSPTTSSLQTGGSESFVQKEYIWNFAINKTLATTNGTLGVNFTNNYFSTNSAFASVNPAYTPALELSLNQPLLRNFGNQFATINVRIAESNQKEAQYSYEQQLNDFVLKVGSDYWNVVRAEENLEVANKALAVAQDLVRQNTISVNVGVLAPLSLKEAQSEAATDLSNVYQAEGALDTARAVLRQDVMFNPEHTFLPVMLEPVERPNPQQMPENDEQSLELAMMYRPELAAMRESIRSFLLQVKYAENQTLPQFNIGAQFGVTSTAGAILCNPLFAGSSLGVVSNCMVPAPVSTPGIELPFKGRYPESLDRLWRFSWYNYAIVFNFERPLNNDAAKAALAQARIEYEQERMRYRDLISQVVVDVQSSLDGLKANFKSAQAARTATEFAAASLHDERERFRVGMATTHELLQFIDSLVGAEGNQVNAEANFEISKLAVKHSEGTLMRAFNIEFIATNPDVRPWYGHF
ncbi:MAG: TolC family protein [Candidatus Binataceae bacterium]